MSNPLNELPFDLNTLIPFSEFNWDTIDGLDQIHKDITTIHGNILKSMMKPIAKADAATAAIGVANANNAINGLTTVQNAIAPIDSNIQTSISTNAAPLLTQYGSTSNEGQYYIVMRYTDCGNVGAFIEQWITPPTDRVSYGPYGDLCTLRLVMDHYNTNEKLFPLPYRFDPLYQAALDSSYATMGPVAAHDPGCTLASAPFSLMTGQTQEQTLSCPLPSIEATPIVAPVSPVTASSSGNVVLANAYPEYIVNGVLTCGSFCLYQWLTDAASYPQPTAENAAIYGLLATDLPIYWNGQGKYLTTPQMEQMKALCSPCGGTPTPTPITEPTATPITTPIANTITTPIPDSGLVISSTCCDDIVNALKALAIAPSPSNQNETMVASGLDDEQYLISASYESDASIYLKRLKTEYNPSASIDSIVSSLNEVRKSLTDRSPGNFEDTQEGLP
jgi:hypothetical protein